jgi:hypothetical protein
VYVVSVPDVPEGVATADETQFRVHHPLELVTLIELGAGFVPWSTSAVNPIVHGDAVELA